MLKRLRDYVNQSFRRRLLFFFVPYIVALLIAMTLLLFNSFFNTLKQEKENSTRTLVYQIRDNFDYYYRDIKNIMAYISINGDVQQALTRYETMSFAEQYFLNNRIANAFSNVNVFKNFINDIIIIGHNGYVHNLPNYYAVQETYDWLAQDWLQTYHPSGNSNFGFTGPHLANYYVANSPARWVVSSVLPLMIQGRTLGYVQGDIDYEKLRDGLDTVYRQNEIEITVVTTDGVIIFDRDLSRVNTPLDPALLSQLEATEGTFVNQGQGDSSLNVYLQSEVTGWYLIASIPYSALLNPAYQVSSTILFVILPVSLLIALALFLFLSDQIRQPWSKLVHRIETVTVADYEPAQIDYGVGEIAELGDKFEAMLALNKQLIEQVYVAEICKKNAELYALREQITPHFVYNSLQVIKAEAIFAKNKAISQVVTAIAELLRYSMDTRASQVTVADELNYVRNYLDIYKRRYIGKFEYQIDVPEAMLSCRMQKMVLQPLVENCLKHGFENMKTGGCIQITGRREGDDCVFEVQDNGKGIAAAKLLRLREELDTADQAGVEGIGLFNVHQRIVMEYGLGYGIRAIESQEGAYTRIILKT
ncbi:MAG: histidine kinase [Chloroflexi bacterium]|nr:histidine kinase [Chloroflexota bacterium]